MSELKPCPFCGSGWLYETRRNGYCDETPTMFCNSCKAVVTWEQVEEEGVNDKTKAFVREHWNSRAVRTCKFTIEDNMNETEGMGDVWIECSACHCVFDFYADEWLMKMSYCPNCGARRVGE